MIRTLKIHNGFVYKTIRQEGLVEIRLPIQKITYSQDLINNLGDLRIK